MKYKEIEDLKDLKTKYILEKLKLKYEAKLIKKGFYFLDVVKYNERYFYLEFKNMKSIGKLLFSIIRIWKDLKTKNTEAEFIINNPEEQEHRHYEHLSMKELFDILNEIEKTKSLP